MTTKLYIFLIPLLFSCGPRSGVSVKPEVNVKETESPDPNKLKYVDNIFAVGQDLFKYNCASCHHSPNGTCGPGEPPFLINIFNELPADSLPYYMRFVKNSNDIRTNQHAPHEFGKTLSDSLIKTVVEYIWLTSKARAHH